MKSEHIGASIRTEFATNKHGAIVAGPLHIVVEVDDASDLPQASLRSAAVAEVVVSALALIARAPVGPPMELQCYEIRPDDGPRPFREFVHDETLVNDLRPQRRVDVDRLIDVYKELDDLSSDDDRKRMVRALRAHRRALDEDDALDRALSIAMAFEALNPLLSRHLNVDDFRVETCAGCGRETRTRTLGGVDGWLIRESGNDVAQKHRRLRNGYVHGFRDLGELMALANEIGQEIETDFVASVFALLGMMEAHAPATPMGPRIPYQALVLGAIVGPVEVGVAAAGVHPHVSIETAVVGSRNVDDGKGNLLVEYDMSNTWTAKLPTGVRLVSVEFLIPHDPETEYGAVTSEFIPSAIQSREADASGASGN